MKMIKVTVRSDCYHGKRDELFVNCVTKGVIFCAKSKQISIKMAFYRAKYGRKLNFRILNLK